MGEQGTGHRQRLKDRFNAGDAAALTDVALLELLLTFAIPRADVRPLAQALIACCRQPSIVAHGLPALSWATGSRPSDPAR